ncbi:hypothetical protein E2C01_061667 [Portunus trituberculatus]|uniref:Uncharacterized protein n=1 Tax=Portunus trituberculatus TaxID=210409 RepID=A0A5B7H5V4_PORTR|nr:hypothetical protein [Portunus trituberculatus]
MEVRGRRNLPAIMAQSQRQVTGPGRRQGRAAGGSGESGGRYVYEPSNTVCRIRHQVSPGVPHVYHQHTVSFSLTSTECNIPDFSQDTEAEEITKTSTTELLVLPTPVAVTHEGNYDFKSL